MNFGHCPAKRVATKQTAKPDTTLPQHNNLAVKLLSLSGRQSFQTSTRNNYKRGVLNFKMANFKMANFKMANSKMANFKTPESAKSNGRPR